MPLPEGGSGTPWPPANLAPVTERLCAWSAWYSGSPDELEYVYGTGYGWGFDSTSNNRIKDRPSQYRGGVVGRFARWFWGEPLSSNQKRSKLHVPLASDIATASADLLFSEPPTITVDDDTTQQRLDELVDFARLTEAAEVSAGLGGVYLRTCWDTDLSDKPWLSAVHADAAVPEWKWDRLAAVTFWRVIQADDKTVVRHLERHEPGWILHGVYEGTPDNLGDMRFLSEYTDTRGLDPVTDTGIKKLTATYIPNMRPNRLWRNLPAAVPLGRADISTNEPFLDALDETWSSWMRDVRNGKGRMVVPETMLQSLGPGRGAMFDTEREVYEALSMLGSSAATVANSVQVVQFAIRVQEHRETVREQIETILRGSGYAPQTFGLAGDVAITATEVAAKERKSLITRDKKINYWSEGLPDALETLLLIDKAKFPARGVVPDRPEIKWPDAVSADQATLAQTAQLWRAAEAASTETIVQLIHPDWTEDQIQDEVRRIAEEKPSSLPDFGFPNDEDLGTQPRPEVGVETF